MFCPQKKIGSSLKTRLIIFYHDEDTECVTCFQWSVHSTAEVRNCSVEKGQQLMKCRHPLNWNFTTYCLQKCLCLHPARKKKILATLCARYTWFCTYSKCNHMFALFDPLSKNWNLAIKVLGGIEILLSFVVAARCTRHGLGALSLDAGYWTAARDST